MENGDSRKQTSGNSKENAVAEKPRASQFSTIVREADDFTDRWTNGEIVIDYDKAKDLSTTTEEGKNFWGRSKKIKQPFCDLIGLLIATYQIKRDLGGSRERYEAAFELMVAVQKAKAFNALKDARQQQRDYEQEIYRLKEQIDTLRKLNERLATENKRLHNLLPATKGKGDTEVGDVGT